MARINYVDVVIGVGAGALDEALERADAGAGRLEGFKAWHTWSRIGLTALGYLGQAMNFWPAFAAPIAQSEVPLLTKSVYAMIASKVGTPTTTMVSHPRTSVRIMQSPQKPGFQKVGLT
jgi:hypothetical protein